MHDKLQTSHIQHQDMDQDLWMNNTASWSKGQKASAVDDASLQNIANAIDWQCALIIFKCVLQKLKIYNSQKSPSWSKACDCNSKVL